jgi:hypothetical protein
MIAGQVIPLRRGASINGLGQGEDTSDTQSMLDSILQSVSQLGQAYVQYQMQHDLYELNLARAQQGQPPISPQAVAPGVNVGLTPETQKLLIYGGIALIGVFIFMQMGKRR